MFSSNTSSAEGGYQISRSLRFNKPDSANLSRTPSSAGNRRTWTWSAWVKRSVPSTNQSLFCASGANTRILLNTSDQLFFDGDNTGNFRIITTPVYRDFSAWYHIVLAVDTTQATSSNRIKLYVNGSQVTDLATAKYPAQNTDTAANNTVLHGIGIENARYYFDGYMTEIYMVDGQALTPSSFGETNAQTGVWQPKAYTGSYGTNGFYLNFSDNSNTTAATLGKDYSGNGNNWTPNNFSVTAGAGNDSLVDSPTAYGTDTGAGGTVRGNYCTMNPLQKGSTVNIANGNLDVSNSTSGGAGKILGSIGVSSGKWYAEATMSGGGGMPGISEFTASVSQYPGGDAQSWGYNNGGDKYYNGSNAAYGASFTTNDVIGLALDMDAGSITFYKNGVSQGVAYSTGISGKTITFAGRGDTTTTESWNFGQRPFAYTPPAGYKSLCATNLPTPTIGATTTTQAGKYFNPVLYTGNSSTQAITGVGFQPDFIWTKMRSNAQDHGLVDAVRGGSSMLFSNLTNAQDTSGTWISAFSSDGYTIGSATNVLNGSGYTYVSWNWKANGSGSTNTAGSITSTVSANTTSGFSIVTYTGNGTASTVGHGLGVAPSMVIVKQRSASGNNWGVYHASPGATKYLELNTTIAATTGGTPWNNTEPTSTVFTVGTWNAVNANGSTYVAYCFSEIAGYSKFGSYTGNGSTDGPFIFTGFRPRYIMVKVSSTTNSWVVLDAARSPSNVALNSLFPNLSNVENTADLGMDFLSNGFKIRNSNANSNENGQTFIFAAFAEFPQKFSLAR